MLICYYQNILFQIHLLTFLILNENIIEPFLYPLVVKYF